MKFGTVNTHDDSIKELVKRVYEKFEIRKFKYVDDTLTTKERALLHKHGPMFQLFVDGKFTASTEEYKQIMDGSDKATGTISKPVQVWFKYQSLLKDEEEGRKLTNKERATNIKRPRLYHGE